MSLPGFQVECNVLESHVLKAMKYLQGCGDPLEFIFFQGEFLVHLNARVVTIARISTWVC